MAAAVWARALGQSPNDFVKTAAALSPCPLPSAAVCAPSPAMSPRGYSPFYPPVTQPWRGPAQTAAWTGLCGTGPTADRRHTAH